MNTLSERIKKHRDELGLTQNELSRRLGCRSRSSINKILAFAAALDVSPSYLLGWKDDMPEPIRTICIPVFGKMPAQ